MSNIINIRKTNLFCRKSARNFGIKMERKMKVPVEKNKEYVVDIIDNGFEGEGIAKINNFTIFIPNAIKGEKI